MSPIKNAEILCVGTELLLGQITNTNAAWLARELSLTGIHSYYQTVVGDNPERLSAMLELAAGRSDLIILTGGLGPTQDDLTMAVAAQVAGLPLKLHEPSRAAIEHYFTQTGRRQITDNNWKQALMPDPSIVLPNHNGTAPGAIFEMRRGEKVCTLVLLPGPPSEMQLMFRESVAPYLEQHTATRLRHCFVRLIGIGESAAETRLLDLINGQGNPTLASYASEGEVMFRITQSVVHDDDPDLTAAMLTEVKKRVGEFIYEIGPRTMPEVVYDLLLQRQETIGFAESCTGGLISAQLTDLAGVSAVFRGSVVAYNNQVKTRILHVSPDILAQYGAVSAECAEAMAIGCRDVLGSDWAVSVTGIAGPDGGSAEKPIGLVFLAVAGPNGTMTKRLQLTGNRLRIRKVSALNAFDLLRRQLIP
ncbi:MAG: competence/damage-inducible protein A [Clostridiaceae bacterium]|nr:competence/damage-inducible protein A [Clostridiaceae bacterium]